MISINTYNEFGNNFAMELYGLSTDTKPIGNVNGIKLTNGSTLYCMDTKNVYIYDEQNAKWWEV